MVIVKKKMLDCYGDRQKRMSDVQLGGMLKHVKVKIYQVDVGLGWVYVPDRGAAHTKAWVHDRAQLVWQVWSQLVWQVWSKWCRGKL